ncbi:MAG: nodulation protein NfeD, partial [Candidatus Omnitrophica bacterium]|nr:nodulation protein NfeD [Candidatus Omnitrophota bacterium]
NNAQAVIFEIDTFGGRVDAATEICGHIEELSDIPVIAFVDDQAWSAGALISLACKKIIMSEGSSIGSAEPRASAGGKPEPTDEKMTSALRAKFRAVAEQNGHSPALAEAMVDKDIALKKVKLNNETAILTAEELELKIDELGQENVIVLSTIIDSGKLLNLSAKEAKELDLASDILSTRKDVLEFMSWPEEIVVDTRMTWSEKLVRFLTHPAVSPMLLTLGFLGLIFELRIPGWGISGTLGLIFLALFFGSHYLIGLANWTELFLFLAGVILLILEIFVIPGFGLAGISGIALLIISLFLAMVKHPFTAPEFELAAAANTLVIAFLVTVPLTILLFWLGPKTPFLKKLILASTESKKEGYQAAAKNWEQFLNKTGRTLTLLRPAGRAVFDDKVLDVVTQGDFIEKDKPVKVIEVEGSRIVVEENTNV